jgi:hypothetical protein
VFSLDFPWLGKCCVLSLLDLYIYFGFPLARLKWRILPKLVRLPLQDDEDDEEDFMDWIDQLHRFLHQINVINICPPPNSDFLPLPFPHISTLTQATDLSEEDTTALDTTNSDIEDNTLAPQSVQAKVNDSHLLKVF